MRGFRLPGPASAHFELEREAQQGANCHDDRQQAGRLDHSAGRDGKLVHCHGALLDRSILRVMPAELLDLSQSECGVVGGNGVPERIRTSDLRFRKPLLYPAELRGRARFLAHLAVSGSPLKVGRMSQHQPPPIGAWQLLHSTYSYRDKWLALRSDTVLLPNGETLSPYHTIEAPDWVNAVAITERGEILLVEQYRHAVKETMLELPAGHVDQGEAPGLAVRRELVEETGHEAESWHELSALFPVASRFTNKVHSYLAIGAREVRAPTLGSSENIRVHKIPWRDFVEGLYSGALMLREANQLASILLVHLLARSSADPLIARLRV
jgi:ADP-ribose pyrophosphatase